MKDEVAQVSDRTLIHPPASRNQPSFILHPSSLAAGAAVRYQPTIREMPVGERPRERMRDAGPESLSNGELLAILLRTGSVGENVVQLSGRLLTKWGGLSGLARVGFPDLCAEHGMGEAKACRKQLHHAGATCLGSLAGC